MTKKQSKWMSIAIITSVFVTSLAMTGCNPNRSSKTNTETGTTSGTSSSKQQPGSVASPATGDTTGTMNQSGSSDSSVMDQGNQNTGTSGSGS